MKNMKWMFCLLIIATGVVCGEGLNINTDDCSTLRNDFTSVLWDDARVINAFKVPVDFAETKPADDQTTVKLVADRKNLSARPLF